MAHLSYEIVDVFTDRPYAGNPLAVVLGADGLDRAQMQAIAAEFHLSETAFVLRPGPGATYRVRIFTPAQELPFAGHPSVGTAATLARLGLIPAGEVVQECGAGLLPITTDGDGALLTGGTPTVGGELDPRPLLAAVGLTDADYAGPAPRVAGVGVDFPFLSVRPDAVARARTGAPENLDHVTVFAWDPATRTAHTRMFAPGLGVPEDPATGSSALAFGVWLVASGLVPGDGATPYTVLQGAEIGRPSTLSCVVTTADGAVTRTTVAGGVAPVARGEITVPS